MKKWMILALSVFVLVACGSEEDGNEAIIDEAEAFIEHLENGDFEAASGYFSDEMKEQLSAEELEQVYGELNEMCYMPENEKKARAKAESRGCGLKKREEARAKAESRGYGGVGYTW